MSTYTEDKLVLVGGCTINEVLLKRAVALSYHHWLASLP